MAKKTIYRTVIQIEVLSEDPIPEGTSITDIEQECDTGSYSGTHSWMAKNQPITGQAAADLLLAQGSSVDFFGMDEEGNDIRDDSEE